MKRFVFTLIKVFNMIYSISITLLVFGTLVGFKRHKRKKRGFYEPINQLPN